jgi:hypothetical protein
LVLIEPDVDPPRFIRELRAVFFEPFFLIPVVDPTSEDLEGFTNANGPGIRCAITGEYRRVFLVDKLDEIGGELLPNVGDERDQAAAD